MLAVHDDIAAVVGLGFPFDGSLRVHEGFEGLFVPCDFLPQDFNFPAPVLLGRNGIRGFQFPVLDGGAVEDSGEGVVIALGNGVELVIVAAGAAERQAEEDATHGVDLFIDNVSAFLDRVLFGQDLGADGEEAGGCNPVGGGGSHEIAGQLFAHELVVGEIAIKGVDDPVAIAPGEWVSVVFVTAVGVAVAGEIEPVAPPAFTVMRGGQQFINDLRPGPGRLIGEEGFHLGRGRRETDQVEVGPAQQDASSRPRDGGNRFVLTGGQAEAVERSAGPAFVFHLGQGRWLQGLEGPVRALPARRSEGGTEDGENAQTERCGTEGDGCLPYHTGPKTGKRDRRFLRVIEMIKPDVFP